MIKTPYKKDDVESDGSMRLFIEHAPAAIAMFDRDMHYLAASRRWLEDYKLGKQDVIGQSHYEIFPELPEAWKRVHRRALQGEVIAAREDRFDRTDGTTQWLNWEVRPWYTATKEIGGIVIFTEDVTDRWEAQRELERRNQKLEKLMDIVPVAVWIANDIECKIITGNALANKIFEAARNQNVSATTIPGARHLYDMNSHELSAEEMPMQVAATTNREIRDVELAVTIPSGKSITLFGNAVPLRDEAGHAIGSIGAFQDITQRKEAEETRRAQAIDRARRETIQNMELASLTAGLFAHEINQPLAAIVAYSSSLLMMAEQYSIDPIMLATIEKCETQALRAGDSIRRLISIIKSSDIPTESFDLSQEIIDMVNVVRAENLLPVRIHLSLADGLPPVRAKRAHLQQVLLNLLRNSIDALREAKIVDPDVSVLVATENGANKVRVTIKDNGPGISQKVSERMFNPFYTTKKNGIGVGLPISRSLMEINEGRLWFDSDDGPGATFHMTIPLAHT